MKRIGLMVLALAALGALSGITATASMATTCVLVDEPNTGNWTNPTCTEKVAGVGRNWIRIQNYTNPYGIFLGQWCAETEELNTGDYIEPTCTTKGANAKYIRIYEHPDWFVHGMQLKQGSKNIKLQLKGKAKLAVPKAELVIECKSSASESSAIEGSGMGQGRDKGKVTYKECVTNIKECKVAEPITTNQIKSYLGTIAGHQTKIVDVLEPENGNKFVELKLSSSCGVLAGTQPVEGSVAAELIPAGEEGKEGLDNYPEAAITTVDHEGVETAVGLKIGATNLASTFSGAYGAELESGEPFGVGGGN
jgi:hypothetical protein